jgi:phosphatidylglycerol lysyltransferase
MKTKRPFLMQLVAYGVALHGLFLIASAQAEELFVHYGHSIHLHISGFNFNIPLFMGLTLLYVSLYLRRGKWTAWLSAVVIYVAMLLLTATRLFLDAGPQHHELAYMFRGILLPSLLLFGLVQQMHHFKVKSDLRSFAFSVRFIVLVLGVTFIYGVSGMILMDRSDFHREISFGEAMHQTIDQFGLTTDELTPHTRRAKVFLDSLSVVSTASVGYGLISLFQPLRARLSNEVANRKLVRLMLKRYGGNSEDFFKLWPYDKHYFWARNQKSGLAYDVHRGVVVTVGDPFGEPKDFPQLLEQFDEFCRTNDWQSAFIHTVPAYNNLYKDHGYGLQKIGEEAIISLQTFTATTIRSKYFRQINNRFTKNGYRVEMLHPPHSAEVIERLQEISDEWLSQPGRAERGFLMGWFSEAYMQQCDVLVLRDSHGSIQAFLNQVPSYDAAEANFDFLRHSSQAPSNSNDFLLMEFANMLHHEGFTRLNMGLCPLSGLDEKDEERGVIDNALRFVYANGDRFYSFSGLRRFKAKYDPQWESRYIAYRGGIRGFTRVLTALNRALRP